MMLHFYRWNSFYFFFIFFISISNISSGTVNVTDGYLEIKEPIKTSESHFSKVSRTIDGRVTDSLNSPLPGVSVFIKEDRSIGTTTDLNGRYSLEIPDDATTLVFSMIGFDEQEVLIKNESQIDVSLYPSTSKLGETVVVAFGKQKKEEVVGSVTTITPDELKIPSSNLTASLAGRMAGMIAYQRSGEPGADNADFFIRGVTTFGFKKDPLILVDDIELSANDLAKMQVDDIASFSILKDATATALYGARGANGVILITTKEGKEGKARVSIRVENSISSPTRDIKLADPITYMKLNNEAVLTRDPLGGRPYSNEKIDNTISGINPIVFPQNDWKEILFKRYTMNQRVNLNINGGGKVARYYLAGTFNQDNGILKVDHQNNFNNNIDLKTYELRSNVNINLTKSTEVGIKLYGTFDDYIGPIGSGEKYYHMALRSDPVAFAPFYPIDSLHRHTHHTLFGNTQEELVNPYAELVRGYRQYNQTLMLAQFDFQQDLSFITKGLKARLMFNTTRYSFYSINRQFNPFYYDIGFYDRRQNTYLLNAINDDTGTEFLNYNEDPKRVRTTTYIQGRINYDRVFSEKHGVNALLVYQLENNQDGNAGSLQTSLPHRNIGLSGRFTYSFKRKYFSEFDFGYNGSERFYKSHRFGFFPSIGFGWHISKEKFWAALEDIITSLKVRGTYGVIGNDAIGSADERFFYLSDVNMNDHDRMAIFGEENAERLDGVSVNRYSNTAITWESSYKTNVGFDMTLFNNIDIILDLWKEHRKNILMTRAFISSEMGLKSSAIPKANVGEAEGRGIDFSIDYSKVISKDFWMQGRVNFTYALSRFLVYEEPTYKNEPWKSRVGYPITQQWGYIAERLFVDDKEVKNSPVQNFGGEQVRGGDIKYRDINGDGEITTLDQVPIGYPTSPEIVYGFGYSMGFKDFDLSMFFQGLGRESFWINVGTSNGGTYPFVKSGGYKNQLLEAYASSHWSEDERDIYALWPRLSTEHNANNTQTSTWFMRNGAFLRLKSVELGYTMSSELTKRINIDNVRFYLSSLNLLSWSSFKLWDVEMAGNGLGYPIQRVFNMGIQVSF